MLSLFLLLPRDHVLCPTEPSPPKALTCLDRIDNAVWTHAVSQVGPGMVWRERRCPMRFTDTSLPLFRDRPPPKKTWFFLLGFPSSVSCSILLTACNDTFTLPAALWDLCAPNWDLWVDLADYVPFLSRVWYPAWHICSSFLAPRSLKATASFKRLHYL